MYDMVVVAYVDGLDSMCPTVRNALQDRESIDDNLCLKLCWHSEHDEKTQQQQTSICYELETKRTTRSYRNAKTKLSNICFVYYLK